MIRRLVVPGLVFQAVVVGAGYATGRELVQFFMTGSLASGLLGMMVTAVVWGLTLAITFGNARGAGSTDYRSFLKGLIGPLWIAYEICFALLLVVVLSVLASAAGEIVSSRLGWPALVGTLAMMTAVCALVFFGTAVVERFLAFWSVVLYALFALVLIICLVRYGDAIIDRIAASPLEEGWIGQGISYAGYNLAIVPGILYCVRHLKTRREALIAGALAGLIAMVPAVLFFLSMVAFWPSVVSAPVPIDHVLERLDEKWLSAVFYVALFGIFVKTGAALVHAVNERIASAYRERGRSMPTVWRPVGALVLMLVATVLAERVGIVALIAQGYQWLTAAFLIVFVLPLILVGGWRLLSGRSERETRAASSVAVD